MGAVNERCKVRAVDIFHSRARNDKRYLFGLCTSISGDTATVLTDKGRHIQCPKNDVSFSRPVHVRDMRRKKGDNADS